MSIQTVLQTAGELTGEYRLDPAHTRLGFVARHAMVTKVRGRFHDVEGTLVIDAEDPSRSTAEVRARVATVDTGFGARDDHLRSADFLDAENHPELVFRSTAAEKVGDDLYRLTGDLAIRGVTKPVTIELEYTGAAIDDEGQLRLGFEGRGRIDRRDWGLTWNFALEAGGLLVSDKVALELDVSAVRAS